MEVADVISLGKLIVLDVGHVKELKDFWPACLPNVYIISCENRDSLFGSLYLFDNSAFVIKKSAQICLIIQPPVSSSGLDWAMVHTLKKKDNNTAEVLETTKNDDGRKLGEVGFMWSDFDVAPGTIFPASEFIVEENFFAGMINPFELQVEELTSGTLLKISMVLVWWSPAGTRCYLVRIFDEHHQDCTSDWLQQPTDTTSNATVFVLGDHRRLEVQVLESSTYSIRENYVLAEVKMYTEYPLATPDEAATLKP